MTKFGVLGTGRITRRLVADLQSTPGVSVTAIASRTAERAQWYADQYGIANAVHGYAELVRRDDVDAVYVALPPSLHANWSIESARNGKHVLCEKPLALNRKQAGEIDEACQLAGVRWLDATGWLYHERTSAFAQWMSQSRLGELGHISVAVSFFRPFQNDEHRLNPDLGGGCLLDLGWYTVGLIRYMAGKCPNRVFASSVDESSVPCRVNAMLWFDDNVTASFSCGYDTATRKWFEVAGSDASLVCDDFTRPWNQRPTRCWIHERSGDVEQHTFQTNQEQQMILRLVGDEPLEKCHNQALDTHRILDAIGQSIQAQKTISL